MATDLPVRPAARAPYPEDPTPFPPEGRQNRGPAALLRRLIGIRENVLDHVPEERTRYTWYGAIVVNTALLGAGSMALAIATFRADLPASAVVVVAVVWFWVVLALDCWLVSSTHGVPARSPLRVLLPRLALSVLLGIFIAEPLLFQVFDKEIRQQIALGNEEKVADYKGMLVSCNPDEGSDTSDRIACRGYQLKVPGAPAELAEDIKSNTARVTAMRTQVDQVNRTLNGKMATEQRECARNKWIWYGRYADVSETCERARKDSTAYRKTSKIKEYEGDLAALVEKSRTLAAKKEHAADTYRPALQRSIEAKTQQREEALDTDGILTRAHALGVVAFSDWYAAFVGLVLHALLLAVDAMPVLAKLMSGSTTYDRLLTARFDANRRLHSDDLQVRHACATMEYEVRRHRIEQETTDCMQRLEHDYRLAQTERSRVFRAELDARAKRLLGRD